MLLFDLTREFDLWMPIGDAVMGGSSESRFVPTPDGHALFTGTLSLERSGGFASARSPSVSFDLSGDAGIALDVMGDGKRYKIVLRSDTSFDGTQYQAVVVPPQGEWSEHRIEFGEFVPVLRGVRLPHHPPFDRSSLRTLGVLISERQTGPFSLRIRKIASYR